MNFKMENSKRSIDTSAQILKAPLKSIVKDKARKQLWESLLDVYENEASIAVNLDCEEVDVNQLEVWSVSHAKNTFRALPHVARTNPQLLTDALPGAEELQLENQENLPRRKNTRLTTTVINKTRKSSSSFKIYKSTKPIAIKKKRTIYKKNSEVKSSFKLEHLAKITSKQFQEQTNTDVKNVDDISNNPTIKRNKGVRGKKLIHNQNKALEHNCNLKMKYFDISSNLSKSSRLDGRTFYCKLIFKVCECDESDEVF